MPAATDATYRSAQTFFETALLGMLASGYFAVLGSGELDLPTAAIMFAALCARALYIAGVWHFEFPPRLATFAAFAYLAFYPADVLWLSHSFLTATVHMIFFVAVVKILTASAPRDFISLTLIAGMELLAAALLSTHLSFFAFLATFLLCGIATFVGGDVVRSIRAGRQVSTGDRAKLPWRLTAISSALFCGILMMTAALFFVLPRTARAAFQRFVPQRYHLPGFSSQIALGEIGELKQNSAPVLHIRSYDGRPLAALHWRGSALATFDGQRWFNPPVREQRLRVDQGKIVLPQVSFSRPGRSIGYEVQLSEIAPDMLFFAGTPETISIQAPTLFRSVAGAIRAPRFGMAGLRYGAYSRIENQFSAPTGPVLPLPPLEHDLLLQLPKLDPRVAELARSWSAGTADPERIAQRIEDHFHKDFSYSLAGLREEVADPLAHFLFESKQGHCEYFASSMAVMLRSQGIPARVATGFLGGEFNPLSGWQVIRASDAHSWVEAWIPDHGWMMFDPTPADSSIPQDNLWSRASLVLDAADQFWRDWVLSYDFDHQLVLASRVQAAGRGMALSRKWPDWSNALTFNAEAAPWWIFGISAGGIGVFLLMRSPAWISAFKRRRQLLRATSGHAAAPDATLLYEQMLTVLAGRGYQKPVWVTPQEFADVLPHSELSLLVADLTNAYNQVRFGGQLDAAPRMASLLQRIESMPGA